MSTEIENPNVASLLRQIEGLVERLSKYEIERDELRAECVRLRSLAGDADKLNIELHAQLAQAHADGAVMRGALEEMINQISDWRGTSIDALLSMDGLVGDSPLQKAVDRVKSAKHALSTCCGADLLDRYLEVVVALEMISKTSCTLSHPDDCECCLELSGVLDIARDTLLATVKGAS